MHLTPEQETLFVEHLPLVDYVIRQHQVALTSARVDLDDAHQEGAIVLIAAITNHDPAKGTLKAYANLRLNGLMRDLCRTADPMGRTQRQHLATIRQAEGVLGENATTQDIAEHTGLTTKQIVEARAHAQRRTLSLDAPTSEDTDNTIAHTLTDTNLTPEHHTIHTEEHHHLTTALNDALATMCHRHATSLKQRTAGATFAAIGELFGVTETRALQLVKAARDIVRMKLARETPDLERINGALACCFAKEKAEHDAKARHERMLKRRKVYNARAYRKHRKQRLEYAATYRTTHRDAIRAAERARVKRQDPQLRAAKNKAWRDANIDKVRAAQRTYWQANKERLSAYAKAYRQENREVLLAKARAWRQANKDKISAQNRAWREKNLERRLAYDKAYYEQNREVMRQRAWERREANRAEYNAQARARRAANREHINAQARARYARKRAKTTDPTEAA